MSNVSRKAANLSIRSDLLEQARELSINLSREFELHLAQVARERQVEQWAAANHTAIKAFNRHVERDGLWSDGIRSF